MRYDELQAKVLELEQQVVELNTRIGEIIGAEGMPPEDQTKYIAEATASMATYLHTANSMLRVARRLGLPENIAEQTMVISKLIRITFLLQMAYTKILAIRAAAGDPLAIAGLAVAIGGVVATASDLV